MTSLSITIIGGAFQIAKRMEEEAELTTRFVPASLDYEEDQFLMLFEEPMSSTSPDVRPSRPGRSVAAQRLAVLIAFSVLLPAISAADDSANSPTTIESPREIATEELTRNALAKQIEEWLDAPPKKRRAGELIAEADAGDKEILRRLLGFSQNFDDEQQRQLYFNWCQAKAQEGDLRAMSRLAEIFQIGREAPQDSQKSMQWYRRGADLGDASCMTGVGFLFFYGFGVDKNQEEAIRWYRRAADGGDHQAMYNLGDIYYRGVGVEKNLKTAYRWYRQAADQENPLALYRLSHMQGRGEGVERDHRKALELMEQSAEKGFPIAIMQIAKYKLLDKNDAQQTKAAHWYFRASQMGHLDATRILGVLLSAGRGVEVNETLAVRCFNKAAQQGGRPEGDDLFRTYAWCFGVDPASPRGLAVLESGAASKDPVPSLILAELCLHGGRVDRDLPRAQELFQVAADAGMSDAMMSQAGLILQAEGSEKINDHARRLINQAAAKGHQFAQKVLDEAPSMRLEVDAQRDKAESQQTKQSSQPRTADNRSCQSSRQRRCRNRRRCRCTCRGGGLALRGH